MGFIFTLLVSGTLMTTCYGQYNFTYAPGFLAAGEDLTSGSYTYDEAVEYCSAQDLCMGFTFQLGPQNCEWRRVSLETCFLGTV